MAESPEAGDRPEPQAQERPLETPVEIDWHGGPAPAHIRDSVVAHIAALEERFGRITACRISVKPPTAHHRTGGPFEVAIHLALPNRREVTVDRHANADARFADSRFAVNDAFKRVRRRLQDQVRRMQGKVKAHEPAPLGEVVRVDRDGGFGFLRTPDGREIYFHGNSVLAGAFAKLEVGTRVAFAEENGDKGPQASTVRVAGKHGMQ